MNGLIPGNAVGETAVGAGDHNGVKGLVLRAVVQHPVEQQRGDLPLRHAGADIVQRFRQCPLGNALGLNETVPLLGILYGTELPEKRRGGNKLTVQLFRVAPPVRHGDVLVLVAYPLQPLRVNDRVDEGGIGVLAVRLPNLGVLHRTGGGLRIAVVRKVVVMAAGHKGDTIRPGRMEAGGVKAVGLAGEQHGVQPLCLQALSNFGKVIHIFDSSFRKNHRRR